MDTADSESHSEPVSTPFFRHFWDRKTFRVLCTVLLFAIALGFLRAAGGTLTLFLFAILFAYFLAPIVSRLQQPLSGRSRAIAAVYLMLIAILALAVLIAGPSISTQARALMKTLPSLLDRLGSGELLESFAQKHHWSATMEGQVNDFLVAHRADFTEFGKGAAARFAQSAQHIWWLVLIPILAFFFLKEGESLATDVANLGQTPTERNIIRNLLEEMNVMLGGYVRSQLMLAGLTLIAYTLVLSVMRVPYAFVLGPLAGILEFVPVVGPALAAVTVIAISVLAGYDHWIWLVLFVAVWRLLQDYVNAPRIMKSTLEIEPLLQIFAVLAGAEIAGVLGALLAVPVFATVRILWQLANKLRSAA